MPGSAATHADTVPRTAVRGLYGDPSIVSAAGVALTAASILVFFAARFIGFETAIFIIAAATAISLAAFTVSPGIGLLGIGLLCTFDVLFRVYVFTELDFRYNTINYVLLAVGVPLSLYLWRLGNRQARWLFAFSALLAAGVAWSPDRFLGMHTLLDVLPSLALIACFARAVRLPDVLLWLALVNGTASAACLFAYFVIAPVENATNVNALAQVPIAGLATLALAASQPGVIRNWLGVGTLAAVNVAFVFLTSSRGGLAVSCLLALYVVLRSPHAWWRSYFAAMFILVAVFGSSRFVSEYDTTVNKWSWLVNDEMTLSQATNSRSDLALYGWRLFLTHPLGVGTGGFVEATEEMSRRGAKPAHSAWVKTLAENGIPGIVLLTGFLLSFRLPRSQDPGRLGLLVICVAGAGFVFVEFQSKSLWLLVAGAAALLHAKSTAPGHLAFVPSQEAPMRSGLRASVLPRPVEPLPDEPPAGEWDENESLEIDTAATDDVEVEKLVIDAPPPAAADPHWEEDDEK